MKNKTAVKTAVKSAPVAVVSEVKSIDQMFQRNALGYLQADPAFKGTALVIEDCAGYVISKLEAGQSAMREAILFSGWVFSNRPEEESKAFALDLKDKWKGSTIANLISISRSLKTFEAKGLSINVVRDLYGLREVSKLIKDEETSEDAVKLLNSGESPRKVKSALTDDGKGDDGKGDKGDNKNEDSTESESLENKEALLETLILRSVERYAILADNDSRLRLTRQIVSKMALGNYILGHTDAIKAIRSLKEKANQ